MAVRTLWKFVLGRTKIFFQNYNVIERAEKIMEADKRAPPRHPGTEAKFKVLIKGKFLFKTYYSRKISFVIVLFCSMFFLCEKQRASYPAYFYLSLCLYTVN